MTKKSKNSLTISDKIIKLHDNLSIKQQLMLVQQIALEDVNGQEPLLELLINRRIIKKMDLAYLDSILFETLYNSKIDIIQQGINNYFPNGIVELKPTLKLDYQPLQKLLINHNYQQADKLTQIYLCQLAGLNQQDKRSWLYFTDISLLPSDDLAIIDILWRIYSRNKFGFSRQRQIWLSNNCNWEKLWIQIGWKNQGIARRYPNEFIWDISAPKGHLPLFNQLRGVQVLSALFDHITWNK